jgi:hypothetical protein
MMPKVRELALQLKILRGFLLSRRNIVFRGVPLSDGDLCRVAQAFSYTEPLCRDLFGRSLDLVTLFDCDTFDIDRFCKELKDVDARIKHYGYRFDPESDRTVAVLGSENWQELCSNAQPSAIACTMKNSPFYPFFEPIIASGDFEWFVSGRGGYACAFRRISTWLNFLLRTRLEDIDLLTDQMLDYEELERELRFYQPTDEYRYLLDIGAQILREWIPEDFDFVACFQPKHGPGAIQDAPGKWSSAAKMSMLHVTASLAEDLEAIGIHWEQYVPNSIIAGNYTDIYTTRIADVPKALNKRRIISTEWCELQYAQQGAKAVIDELLKLPAFARSCNLERQEESRRLAQIGSKTGLYITIDLSSASDTVTCDIVHRLTDRVPWLQQLVFAVRPRFGALPTGKVIPLEKFAPMGSGHCFRVEQVTFMVCCEIALQIAPPNVRRQLCRARENGIPIYWVYGDDIIIRAELSCEILHVLEALNFRVNKEKSFFGSASPDCYARFREACGIECLDGIDVTPLRIPRQMGLQSGFARNVDERSLTRRRRGFLRKCRQTINSPNQTKALMDFINAAFDFGCLHLRSALLADLRLSTKKQWLRSILFADDSTYGIRTFVQYATNFGIKRRMVNAKPDRPSYQRYEMEILAFRMKEPKSRGVDEGLIKLVEELNVKLDDEDDKDIEFRDYFCVTEDDFLYYDWLRRNSGRIERERSILQVDDPVEETWNVPQLIAVLAWTHVDPLLVSDADEPCRPSWLTD